MRRYFSFVLVLAFLVTAGCVEEYDTNATVTTAMTTATLPAPVTTPVPTPAPEQVAYLANIQCGVGDRSEDTYHCNGDVRVRSGPARLVRVIARYADNNTFYSGTGELGGPNAISMPFAVFPDLKYQGQTPAYFVKIDNTLFPVTWSGSSGTAWSGMPVPPDLL